MTTTTTFEEVTATKRSPQTKLDMPTIFKQEAATSNGDRALHGLPGPWLKDYRRSDPIWGQLKVQSSLSCNRCPGQKQMPALHNVPIYPRTMK